jgi:hypothetical protein
VYEEFDENRGMNGECKDRSKWKEVISAYPNGKRRDVCIYVCSR